MMSGLEQFSAITLEQMLTSERFFPMAWVLWEDTHYQKLKSDSKVLYSMMKNRLKLSAKNGWVDEVGRVYIEFSNAEIQRYFNCSKPTAIKLKKDLSDYGLIYEYSQFSNADGQLANRIYVGQVMTYDAEKYKQERLERQEKAFQKRIEKRQNRPRKNNLRGVSKDLTEAVNNFDSNYKDSSKTDFSKDNYSSRKTEKNSNEFSQSAETYQSLSKDQSVPFVEPQYYSLLQVIADKYNDQMFGFPDVLTMTHNQKMKIGQYLSEGYVTSLEVLNMIDRIPKDSASPLAYLLKSLDNLKQERQFEQKRIAHLNAENYYSVKKEGIENG